MINTLSEETRINSLLRRVISTVAASIYAIFLHFFAFQ